MVTWARSRARKRATSRTRNSHARASDNAKAPASEEGISEQHRQGLLLLLMDVYSVLLDLVLPVSGGEIGGHAGSKHEMKVWAK